MSTTHRAPTYTARKRTAYYLVFGFGGVLLVLTGVMYLLTQYEKRKQLSREWVKPEIHLKIALHEGTDDMALVYAQREFFPKEYLVTGDLMDVPSDKFALSALKGGGAQMAVVDVHQLLTEPSLKIVAPVAYAYMCANAADPSILPTDKLSDLAKYKLTTNLADDSLYMQYIKHELPNAEINKIEIRDQNQIEWRAVIRQPPGEVFLGAQPYCSQHEKYATEKRHEDQGLVFDLRKSLGLKKQNPVARVLVAQEDFIKKNGEVVYRVREAMKEAAEAVHKVPTRLETATFYRYQGRVSPEGYSLSFDWEMAYRVARAMTERDIFPEPDEIAKIDSASLQKLLAAAGINAGESQVAQLLIPKDAETLVAQNHEEAEKAYTIHYLSEEEVATKLRLAEGEDEGGAAWEKDYDVAGTAQAIPRIYKGPIKDNFYGAHFIDGKQGWLVGYYGTIIATKDGGRTFVAQPTGVTNLLKSVYFTDANHGWVVGVDGIILHTDDGGQNWVQQKSGTEEYLRDVYFLDPQHGFAAARGTVLLETADGGKSWNTTELPGKRDDRINHIRYANGALWVVGEFGLLQSSRDGGKTWEPKDTGTKNTLTDVAFSDAEHGVITGFGGSILRTIDGGSTWEVGTLSPGRNIFGIANVGPTEMVACGNGMLFRLTLNSSGAWDVANSTVEGTDLARDGLWIYTLANAPSGSLYGVGISGLTITSQDKGSKWQVLHPSV